MGADQSWHARRACGELDPNEVDALFFPHHNSDAAEAKRICAGCDVRLQCLAESIENREEFGVWGGLTERERLPLLPKISRVPVAQCGTESGFKRHIRTLHTKPCNACVEAVRVARLRRREEAAS